MNSDILQLLARRHPSEETVDSVTSSQRGLRSKLDKEQVPQKSRFLDSQVYKDKSARDGSDERSRSTSTAGRP